MSIIGSINDMSIINNRYLFDIKITANIIMGLITTFCFMTTIYIECNYVKANRSLI